jgi:hypothetical protein
MLSNDDMQRLKRLVNLAPLMTEEMQRKLLELIRKLKAIEAQGSMLPNSAIQAMADAVPDDLMRAIVQDNKGGPSVPGWIKREPQGEVVRGTGWQSPPKPEDHSRQFAQFDAMVAHMVGGPNEPVK